MIKKNILILMLFHNKFIIDYLKIIAQLIIIVDLQINQCKFSINLLSFSPLTKVHSQLNISILNHVHSFTYKSSKKLINKSTFLINFS